MAAKETEIQAAILDYLAMRGHFVIRLNNQPIFDPTRKIFRKLPKHTPKGLADILVIRKGQPVFVEVKSEKGKPSQDQLDFGRDAFLAGGMYLVARSIDD